MRRLVNGALAVILLPLLCGAAYAQDFRSSTCRPVANLATNIIRVSNPSRARKSVVRITYVSHASVRIQTSSGLNIATDYSGFNGNNRVPDVVTMNSLHPGHFTRTPDKEIRHVLRGWPHNEKPADHHVAIDGVIVRNATTDFNSKFTGVKPDANSIFIIETDQLCIGHLGHLHHEPTDADYAQIGRLDIVIFPVGGARTLSTDEMKNIVSRLGARIIIPVHWHDKRSLLKFLDQTKHVFPIDGRNVPTADVSFSTLPLRPTMLVLTPETSFPLFAK